MPKPKRVFVCQSCAFEATQWLGQCPSCNAWNSFQEEVAITAKFSKSSVGHNASVTPVKLSEVFSTPPKRLSSNIAEFDRVLGGGFVSGQVILLAGEPGVGKSTLLTDLAKSMKNNDVLYVCGEESVEQIKLRANRMNYKAENLLMLQEINLDAILAAIASKPSIRLVIIDSIQTLYSEAFTGVAGSITQVRGCTQLLTNEVKRLGVPVVLVGHVTKDGTVAGPKVLEHIVDTVLHLEGDSQHMFRLLRTTKNRFGPVSEVGIFEMGESGMREVANPSELFLEQRLANASGSCITVIMEGYRPLLFEVQALTTKTSFGYPRRTTTGFNANRLQVLIAILEKRCGVNLSAHDVYLSIAGGFKVNEYAADLAACLAIVSSLKDKPIKEGTAVFGECGLNGEVRKIPHQEKRIKEAKKLGYENVISPDKVRSLVQAVQQAF